VTDRILDDLAAKLGIPKDDLDEIFESLRMDGYFFTPARSARELEEKKAPIRLAYAPVTGCEKKSQLSFGPFGLSRERYDALMAFGLSEGALHLLLAICKVMYEKTGHFPEDYSFQATDDDLSGLGAFIEFWDLENPFVGNKFVWFAPKESTRDFVGNQFGMTFDSSDYSWWNFCTDFGDTLIPKTLEDFPESYFLFPKYLLNDWAKYMPMPFHALVIDLYASKTRGGEVLHFSNTTELLAEIQDSMDTDQYQRNFSTQPSSIDREFLIKELFEFNSLIYPMSGNEYMDLCLRFGVISVREEDDNLHIHLAEDLDSPTTFLKIPSGWDERYEKFIITGSILFSYLSLDEIVGRQEA